MYKDDDSLCSEKWGSFMGSNSMNNFCDQLAQAHFIFAHFIAVIFLIIMPGLMLQFT